MREIFSISAIILAFFYFLAIGSAVFLALEHEMHWVLAFFAMSWIIILRLWPVLPVLAYIGAVTVWGWNWYEGVALALPLSLYIISHYWTRLTDYIRRPRQKQGV